MKIYAVIPARGGSKGIPKKNLVNLGGLPLIAWSILKAKEIGLIDKILVSTDSDEIAKTALKFGAEVPYLRPAELATDSATTVDAVADLLLKLDISNHQNLVVLLQPTQPFRSKDTINKAIEKCLSVRSGVLTISSVNDHPILMRHIDKQTGKLTKLLPNISSTIRRQDFPKIYKVNGAVYVNFSSDYICKTSLNDNPYAVETSGLEAVDIDDPSDLEYARWLLQRRLIAKPSAKQ